MLNQGQILERKYEVIKILGQGGMGTVYLCRNNRLGNLWAVKEVNSELKNKVDFLTEPNILKKLNHTGIVRIVDIFYEDDNLYIVEDYIEGRNLKEYIDINGPLSSELVVDISLQLCGILDYLHSFKPPIVYRDLKPSNVMLTSDNKVVLIDFGIARVYKENQKGDTVILGSRGYMAPEQFMNNQSNVKTDIYSLGATMFFMLTGKSISVPIDPMSQKSYPEHTAKGLVEIIKRSLAARPENRYSSVKAIISEFNNLVDNKQYTKTILGHSNRSCTKSVKTVVIKNKKYNKRFKLIMIAALVCIIILSVFLAALLKKQSNEKKVGIPDAPKTSVKTEPKEELKKVEPKLEEEQNNQEQNVNDQPKKQLEKNVEEIKKAEEVKKAEEKQNKLQKKAKKKPKVKHKYENGKD
ncbi:protein kinase domain-containing protein [Clostridium neuense]|uniref:non-specific serine/threonine protein kinase n=1 Tax=Clostridium neuense TaxID=1728934 RepID=A0ABW8TIW6_9CLOT